MKTIRAIIRLALFSLCLVQCKKDDNQIIDNPPNPCENVVCYNGGFCNNGSCQCPEGFTGPNCETIIGNPDPCATTICYNGGTCDNGFCQCPDGFTGPNCETIIQGDPCATVICYNGGFCNGGICQCPDGFTGPNCEIQLNASFIGCYEGTLTIETGLGGYSTSIATACFSASPFGPDYLNADGCLSIQLTTGTEFFYFEDEPCFTPFLFASGTGYFFSGNQVFSEKFYIDTWGVIYKNTFVGTKI